MYGVENLYTRGLLRLRKSNDISTISIRPPLPEREELKKEALECAISELGNEPVLLNLIN